MPGSAWMQGRGPTPESTADAGPGADGGPGSDGGPPAPGQIQHVIFLVKENRTFDCYFGAFPGANGASHGQVSDGGTVPLGDLVDRAQGGDHSWNAALTSINGGAMNGFDKIQGALQPRRRSVRLGAVQLRRRATGHAAELLVHAAQNYVLGDNFYSALHGPSFPNHLFTIAAQSGGYGPGGWDGGGGGGSDPGRRHHQHRRLDRRRLLGCHATTQTPVNAPPPPATAPGTQSGVQGYASTAVAFDAGTGGAVTRSRMRACWLWTRKGMSKRFSRASTFRRWGICCPTRGCSWKMYGAAPNKAIDYHTTGPSTTPFATSGRAAPGASTCGRRARCLLTSTLGPFPP